MFGKKLGFVFVLIALIASFFAFNQPAAPADNEVWALQTQTTVHWLQQTLMSKPGTYLMVNAQNDYVFIWNMKDQGFGFTMISQSGKSVKDWYAATGGQSNLVSMNTAKQLRDWLTQNGWKAIPAAAAPEAIKLAVRRAAEVAAAEALAYLQTAGGSMVSFFVFPAGYDWQVPLPGAVQYDL